MDCPADITSHEVMCPYRRWGKVCNCRVGLWKDDVAYSPAIDSVHSHEVRGKATMDRAINTTLAEMDVNATLAERGKRYGDFTNHARITQALKAAMVDSPNWKTLSQDKKEALDMIVHKIARILNGDPNYKDSWHDIVGYAKLAEDRCKE